jgi:hypothetical protein
MHWNPNLSMNACTRVHMETLDHNEAYQCWGSDMVTGRKR